ncbi:heavy-metal-associated domain-containing protein [Nesterenkonia alba]|uniref:heavy-metal-associated domain-containing protein n=1 Tax=Nesterenkonia alba TaxID=515814 RepID=UPI0003B3A283|nr:heavy-metal-associated domain-containing protein [Nesterenkonia alba]
MPQTRHYTVTGMSCDHCENAVSQEVSAIDGVEDIQVSAAAGSLTITVLDDVDVPDEVIVAAVDEAGYTATRAQ